jgi:hypothetical protein
MVRKHYAEMREMVAQVFDIPCGVCGQHTPIYYVYGGRGLRDRPPAMKSREKNAGIRTPEGGEK